jgi:hypothetical protein
MPGAQHRFLWRKFVATANTSSGGFRRWRRSRPFWGGLLLLIAGLELFLSANLTLGDLAVHFGPEGFLSYLLPLLLVLSGALTWVTPGQRLFYGILGLLTAVYSLIGLNLGGFAVGMLVGIVGGALVVAWTPARPEAEPTDPAPAGPEQPQAADETQPREKEDPAATMIVPGFTGGPDDPGLRPQQPGQFQPGEEPPRPPSGDLYRKALVITLVPLTITAALIAGGRSPARAETECPEGLPSRPAAAAKKEAAKQSSAKPSTSKKAAKKTPKASAKPSASASATPTATDDSTGNAIVDGWNGFVEGVGDLLGIGEEEATPSPSTSPSPSDSPEPTTSASSSSPSSPSADPSASASGPSGKPAESGKPSPSASGSASPSPTPSLSDIPCLGPRVFKEASPDDVPQVSLKGGTLETASLQMFNATYDGVVDLPTAKGTISALKFSMTKAVNKPFKLTIPENDGHTTLIESDELTTEGNVRFYTPEFKGNLFGVIPVTFTPESPPPLMLPYLWFTSVKINLAFVRCDTLTADPLSVIEKA